MDSEPLLHVPPRLEMPQIIRKEHTKKEWSRYIQQNQKALQKLFQGKPHYREENFPELFGDFAKRREEAILNSFSVISERYSKISEKWLHNDFFEDWVILNTAIGNYKRIDEESHILYGAALWVLNQIREAENMPYLFPLLPKNEDVLDEVYPVDAVDCSFSQDLIDSVQYVLLHRFGEKPARDFVEIPKTDNDDMWTKNYKAMIALIPKKARTQAKKSFEIQFWKWTDAFFSGLNLLENDITQQYSILLESTEKLNGIRDRYEVLVKKLKAAALAQQQTQKNFKKTLSNPLLSDKAKLERASLAMLPNTDLPIIHEPPKPHFPVPDEQIKLMSDLTTQMSQLGKIHNEEVDALTAIRQKTFNYCYHFSSINSTNQIRLREEFGDEIADHVKPISIEDPYALCFALIDLIDEGSDLPWLFGAGCGLMREVGDALPWGIIEYEEQDIKYSGKPIELPDWNQRKYKIKNDPFPRNLAQIIYEETGCILPSDMNAMDASLPILRRYGIRSREMHTLLLSCMSILHASRDYWEARNLDTDDWNAESENTEENKDELQITQEKTTALQEQVKRLKESLHQSEQRSRELKKAMEAEREQSTREHRELADLRELLFRQETEIRESETQEVENQFPYSVQKNTLVFGGHSTWEKAIKPMLTGDIRFIDKDLVFDVSIIRSTDIIWIQTNAMSHKQYERIIDMARQHKKPVRYFSYASAAKCAEQLMEQDKELMYR